MPRILRITLFLLFCGLLAPHAHAVSFNCPANATEISARIALSGPAITGINPPAVIQVSTQASVIGQALACSYTVKISPTYSAPLPYINCPAWPVTENLLAPVSAPAPGFSAWAFGAPGTPAGASPNVSAGQGLNSKFSQETIKLPPIGYDKSPRTGTLSLCTVQNNPYVFTIVSSVPTGYTCTANGLSLTCNPPTPPLALCPGSLTGSKVPSTNWSATSSRSGYYAPDSGLTNVSSGQTYDTPLSYSNLKTIVGSGFGAETFNIIASPGTGSNLPANVITCTYQIPQLTYKNIKLKGSFSVACTTSCSAL